MNHQTQIPFAARKESNNNKVLIRIGFQVIGRNLATLAYAPISQTILKLQTTPFRKENDSEIPRNFFSMLISSYNNNGFKSLFSGSSVKILTTIPLQIFNHHYRELIFSSINIPMGNSFSSFVKRSGGILLSGILYDGGMLLLQTPIELLYTRLALGCEEGLFTLIKNIFQEEGIKGFYHGFQDLFVSKLLETIFSFFYGEVFRLFKIRNQITIYSAQVGLEFLVHGLKYPFSTLAVARMDRSELVNQKYGDFRDLGHFAFGELYSGFWVDYLLSNGGDIASLIINLFFSN